MDLRAVDRPIAFPCFNNARVTDAKEVGVGNPAEETFCHPDTQINAKNRAIVKPLLHSSPTSAPGQPMAAPAKKATRLLHRVAPTQSN